MAAESLVESKIELSKRLVSDLVKRKAPLLAAFWEFREDADRWTLLLVPTSPNEERRLIGLATDLLVENPYRSVFSLSDPEVDSHQISRARALGAYIRVKPYEGRRIDTTFTDGQYFESVIPLFFAPELMKHVRVA
ncbi:MAG: hypothetical protein AB7F72_05035 [Afipia sp.]